METGQRNRVRLWLKSEQSLGQRTVRVRRRRAEATKAPQQNPTAAMAEVPVEPVPAPAQVSQVPLDATPAMSREQKIRALAAMEANEVRGCTFCRLCKTRTNTVFGEGDPDAQLFFIGEGPGETEDQTGRPFVGRAGQKLDDMIRGMGLRREQVYIANIVKCRPPDNRVPVADEVATCTPYLLRQLEIIRPKVIVTLGLPATQYMLGITAPMGKLRGRWHQWRGIKLMPTYHPSYLLRNYTMETRKMVWSDLQQVMVELGLPIPQRGTSNA